MSWTTSILDLRTLLSDGETDRYRYRKRLFGQIDGSNTSFKTVEFRRITDLTSASLPLGVFVDGTLASVSSDDVATGELTLSSAPDDGQVVEATYYIQWFNDSELTGFLRVATNWLALGDDYTNLTQGLRPAALKYAAAEAYQKLSLKWAEHLSETFRVEDAPDEKRMGIVDVYRKTALDYRKDAQAVRDDFYARSGQANSPLFGNSFGNVKDVAPQR